MRFSFFATVYTTAIIAIDETQAIAFENNYVPEQQDELAQIDSMSSDEWAMNDDLFAQLASEIELYNLNSLLDNHYA